MEYPQINNGKNYNEPLNANVLFWLPPNTPYGNLQLKLVDIVQRIDMINLTVIQTFDCWHSFFENPFIQPSEFMKHRFFNENIIYHIRRIVDELICLVFVLNHYKLHSTFPNNITIDCIGTILRNPNDLPIFLNFIDFLQNLNQTSNAFKHSFMNTDIYAIIGKLEPCIPSLYLHHNNLDNNWIFTNLSLKSQIIEPFNDLFSKVISWLKDFSINYKL